MHYRIQSPTIWLILVSIPGPTNYLLPCQPWLYVDYHNMHPIQSAIQQYIISLNTLETYRLLSVTEFMEILWEHHGNIGCRVGNELSIILETFLSRQIVKIKSKSRKKSLTRQNRISFLIKNNTQKYFQLHSQ